MSTHIFRRLADRFMPDLSVVSLTSIPRGVFIRALIYLTYGVLAFAAFLGIFFAEARMEPTIRQLIVSRKEVRLTPGEITPRLFPPSLHFDTLNVHDAKGDALLARFEDCLISLSPAALLRGRLGLRIDSGFLGGHLTGSAAGGSFFSTESVEADIRIEGASLRALPSMLALDPDVTGRFFADFTFSGPVNAPEKGTADAALRVVDADIANLLPMVKVSRWVGGRANAAVRYESGVASLRDTRFEGGDTRLDLKGRITPDFRNPFASRLDLTAEVRIPASKVVPALAGKKAMAAFRKDRPAVVRLTGRMSSPKMVTQ